MIGNYNPPKKKKQQKALALIVIAQLKNILLADRENAIEHTTPTWKTTVRS